MLKRRSCLYVIASILLISLAAALLFIAKESKERKKYPWPFGAVADEIESNDLINIRMTEGSLSNNGLSFMVFNDGDDDLYFDSSFELQILIYKRWRVIDHTPASWTAEGYCIEPKQSSGSPIDVDFSWVYGPLPEGKYRFIKNCKYGDEDISLSFEFEIAD